MVGRSVEHKHLNDALAGLVEASDLNYVNNNLKETTKAAYQLMAIFDIADALAKNYNQKIQTHLLDSTKNNENFQNCKCHLESDSLDTPSLELMAWSSRPTGLRDCC